MNEEIQDATVFLFPRGGKQGLSRGSNETKLELAIHSCSIRREWVSEKSDKRQDALTKARVTGFPIKLPFLLERHQKERQ